MAIGEGSFLTGAAVFLGAAVVAVPIFKRLGLGSVIGYLVAGAAIGPFGLALIEDADLVGELMDLDDAPGAIGNAVVVAADRHEPIVTDPALELEQGIEGKGRQRLQLRLLRDHPRSGG